MANFLYNGNEMPDIYTVYTPELQETHPFALIAKVAEGVKFPINPCECSRSFMFCNSPYFCFVQ